jgi:competence protein ComEA
VAPGQDRYRNYILIGLAALLAAAVVIIVLERQDDSRSFEVSFADPTAQGPMQVYISGAVLEPGVYEMPDGARVIDALYEAGGPAPDADLEAVNLALRLHDEDQVLVPRAGEAASAVAGASARPGAPVNINTASADALDGLPGIGEVYSQRIVESRASDGPYKTTDDLVARQVLPRATFERIRELITAGP